MSIKELDTIVLAQDIAEHGLERGDIGVVVHAYKNGAAYEVEFMTGGGGTIAVLTLDAKAVRPIRKQEILHAREMIPA
jgi:hypothetical protein